MCTMYAVGIVKWLNQTCCAQRTRKNKSKSDKKKKLQTSKYKINIKTNSSLVISIFKFFLNYFSPFFSYQQDKLYTKKMHI